MIGIPIATAQSAEGGRREGAFASSIQSTIARKNEGDGGWHEREKEMTLRWGDMRVGSQKVKKMRGGASSRRR